MGLGSGLVLLFWTAAGLMVAAGRCLAARKRYTFCFVVACLSLTMMPFGTALGIFTLVVLLKEPVKRLFGAS